MDVNKIYNESNLDTMSRMEDDFVDIANKRLQPILNQTKLF